MNNWWSLKRKRRKLWHCVYRLNFQRTKTPFLQHYDTVDAPFSSLINNQNCIKVIIFHSSGLADKKALKQTGERQLGNGRWTIVPVSTTDKHFSIERKVVFWFRFVCFWTCSHPIEIYFLLAHKTENRGQSLSRPGDKSLSLISISMNRPL